MRPLPEKKDGSNEYSCFNFPLKGRGFQPIFPVTGKKARKRSIALDQTYTLLRSNRQSRAPQLSAAGGTIAKTAKIVDRTIDFILKQCYNKAYIFIKKFALHIFSTHRI